jgi:hypothetical protein
VRIAVAAVLVVALGALAGVAAADHPSGLRPGDPSPLASALFFGGLALVVGVVVVIVVALLTRPPAPPPGEASAPREDR